LDGNVTFVIRPVVWILLVSDRDFSKSLLLVLFDLSDLEWRFFEFILSELKELLLHEINAIRATKIFTYLTKLREI